MGDSGTIIVVNPAFLHQIRSEMMDYGTKGESVPPGRGHVDHVDSRITLGHFPAPQLQSFGSSPLAHFRVLQSETKKRRVSASPHDLRETMMGCDPVTFCVITQQIK